MFKLLLLLVLMPPYLAFSQGVPNTWITRANATAWNCSSSATSWDKIMTADACKAAGGVANCLLVRGGPCDRMASKGAIATATYFETSPDMAIADFKANTLLDNEYSSYVANVVGPSSSVSTNLVSFSGTTGKLLQDSGLLAANIPTMASNGVAGNLLQTAAASKAVSDSGVALVNVVQKSSNFTAANRVALAAGANRTLTETSYTFPATNGTNNQVLKTNGSGVVSWQDDFGGTGDVVGPATSKDAAIAFFDGTTGKLIKDTGYTKVNGTAGANSGISVYGQIQAMFDTNLTVVGAVLDGPNMSVTLGAAGYGSGVLQLRTSAAGGFLTSLKASNTLAAPYTLTFPSAAPAINQILQSDASGNLSWIATPVVSANTVTNAGVSTDNAIPKFDLATGKIIQNSGVLIDDSDNVSAIGDLRTTGDIVSAAYNAAAGLSINYSTAGVGNNAYTSASCGAVTLAGMTDGGVYALAIKGTAAATCVFTYAGVTLHYPVGHGVTTAGKQTLYTFMRLANDIYIGWSTGL